MLRPTKRQRVECPPSWLDCASLQTVPAAAATTTTSRRRTADDGQQQPPTEVDGMIRTPLASSTTLDIFLDRFRREVVERHGFAVARPMVEKAKRQQQAPDADTKNVAPVGSPVPNSTTGGGGGDPIRSQGRIRTLLRRRIAVGLNECTRALQEAAAAAAPRHQSRFDADSAVMKEDDPGRRPTCGAFPLLVVVASEGARPAPTAWAHLPVLARLLDVPLLLLPSVATRRHMGRLLGVKSASVLTFLSAPSTTPPLDQQEKNHEEMDRKSLHCPELGLGTASVDGVAVDEAAVGDGAVDDDDDTRRANADLDSFLAFILGKVEGAALVSTRSPTER